MEYTYEDRVIQESRPGMVVADFLDEKNDGLLLPAEKSCRARDRNESRPETAVKFFQKENDCLLPSVR